MWPVTSAPVYGGYFDGGIVPLNAPGDTVWCVVDFNFNEAFSTICGFGSTAPFQVVLGSFPDSPAPLTGLSSLDEALSVDYYGFIPTLKIRPSSTNAILITWEGLASMTWRYVLQQSPDMDSHHWYSVPVTPNFDGQRMQAIVPLWPGPRYFRVRFNPAFL